MAMRAGTGTRDEDTIQLYDDAADIADVPLHVHEAHDVPESVLPAHCVRLARPASDVVYPPGTSVLDGATEVYIVQRRDADGDVHPALRAAHLPRRLELSAVGAHGSPTVTARTLHASSSSSSLHTTHSPSAHHHAAAHAAVRGGVEASERLAHGRQHRRGRLLAHAAAPRPVTG